MSDNIPLEIQVEIIKRFPVKSLIQFRSVSRAWKSLIDGSDFIARYSGQQHLLVRYRDSLDNEPKYVSIVDDTYPHQKVYTTLHVMVKCSRIIRGSHGLLCLYFDVWDHRCRVLHEGVFATDRAVLWNPSIRKAVDVVVPNVSYGFIYKTTVGFGVCPETSDPKIVKITYIDPKWCGGKNVERITHIPWQVEVFTLSTGAWRSPYGTNLPRKSIKFCFSKVTIDGFMYWLGTNRIANDARYSFSHLIISFDMKSEEFREVNLPYSIAHDFYIDNLSISKLRNSLVVLVHKEYEMVFAVWRMEVGVPNSFTKLFTICTPDTTLSRVLEFRKTGEPIIEILERCATEVYDDRSCDLDDDYMPVVYEPYSKCIKSIGISGPYYSLFVYSYTETLLLLDQPGFIISDKKRRAEN